MNFPDKDIKTAATAGATEVKELKATIDNAADDLQALLTEATEIKPDYSTTEPEPLKMDGPQPDEKDFEPEPFIPSGPSFMSPEPPKEPPMPFDQQAELIIAMVDGLQTLTLPSLYMNSIFNGEERDKLKDLKKRRITKDQFFTESPELADKYFDFEQLKDGVPFTNDEVKLLKNPLEAVMKKYNFSVGPEFLLVGALFTVMTPRILPLFTKLG